MVVGGAAKHNVGNAYKFSVPSRNFLSDSFARCLTHCNANIK